MRQRIQSTSLLIIVLLLIFGFSSNAKAATIAGTVTLDGGGHPAANTLTFVLKPHDSMSWNGCDYHLNIYPSTSYDAATGAYMITGIDADSYYLYLDKIDTNLVPEWSLGENIASSEDCSQAVLINVATSDELANYDFQMAPGGIISGIVGVTGSGETLGSIQIQSFLKTSDNACGYENQRLISTQSANDGTYTIMGLPLNAEMYFKAEPYGQNYFDKWYVNGGQSTADCSQAQTVTFINTTAKTDGHFFLTPGAIIRGIVTDSSTGDPLAGIGIDVITPHDSSDISAACNNGYHIFNSKATSEADGSFEIIGLAPETYMLHTSPNFTAYIPEYWASPNSVVSCLESSLITTESDTEYPGKDFQLEVGSSISGIISDNNTSTPIPGITVTARANEDGCGSFNSQQYSSATNQDGYFIIPGLPIGEYNLQAFDHRGESTVYLSEWWDNVYNSWEAVPVSVTATGQNIQNKNMQLEPGSTISGIIRKAGGDELTAEELSYLRIAAYSYSPEWPCLVWGSHYGTIQPDGSYSISEIPLADYRVIIKGNGTFNYIPSWSIGPNSSSQCDTLTGAIQISESNTHVNDVDFQLDSGATITGTVINDDASAVLENDYEISLSDTSNSNACDTWTLLGYIPVTAGGNYTMTGIPPGDFSVNISSTWQGPNIVEEWVTGPTANSTPDCLLAESINIPNAATIINDRNFQVATGGTISGTVYESDGITINTDTHIIRFHESCDSQQWISESWAFCGNYTSQALLPANYYVSLVAADWTTTIGWLSESGTPVQNCAEAQAVFVEQDVTTSGMDFILRQEAIYLTPIYLLLLNQ